MNKLQMEYAKAKAAYEAAFKNEDWDLVEELEDPLLDAEFALIDWVNKVVVATGKMSQEDVDFIKKNANSEQWEKLIDMGMRLAA